MKDLIIASDFDGTISRIDTLYNFFKIYAKSDWLKIEKMWTDGQIGSRECLIEQFKLVNNLDENLIDNYTKTIELDSYFKEFNDFRLKNNIDFLVVSDGVDYFIESVFKNHNIENINIYSNHAEFINNEFKLSFPNYNQNCKNKSGTCKCKILNDLKTKYKKVIYIGDGQSDFCASDIADILFAKKSLLKYCKENNINCIEYNNFKDVIENIDLNVF